MKKVLITGANSYIGMSFEKWVKSNCDEISLETQDMIGDEWKSKNFGQYDSIFHVAGIAHADVGNVTEEQKILYYKVNTDLTIECAKKAKAEGVKQFVFMSSIIVYGESAGIGKERVITKDTPLTPANFYGDSKVKAEEGLLKLQDKSFNVVILRPPMIYGKGSKGNYPLLVKFARKLLFFPKVENKRSILYVGNLCKFISLMILNEEKGIFYPQNKEYVQTYDLVREIAKAHGKHIYLISLFNPMLKLMGYMKGRIGGIINKAFGNMVYDRDMSEYKVEYRMYDFRESINFTEKE